MGQPSVLGSGPWRRVFSTTDPYDDSEHDLQDAQNMYIPDTGAGSGAYQRPAFVKSIGTLGHSARASALFHFTSTTGTEINFYAVQGKLYSVAGSNGPEVDVTPVGVAIDAGMTTRCYMTQLNDQLIFTDGVNRPWIGTNLSATPITGTYIAADGAAAAWTAYGAPFIQAGAVGFVLGATSSLAGLVPRLALLWSEPNQPAVGYLQTGYTDWFNVIETSQRPITAVVGRDYGLIVFRDRSIGLLVGALSGNLSSGNTQQLVSNDIGLLAPATIGIYHEHIYFADQFGRPQHISGLTLVDPPMWLQMRQYVESQNAAAGYATAVTNVAIGVIEPNLNLYLCAPFASSSLGVNNIPPTTAYAFDARNGSYLGRWTISAGSAINGFGVMLDANGAPQLWATAESTAGNNSYGNWSLQRLSAASWSDSGAAQAVLVQTTRLGYSAGTVWDAGGTGDLVTMGPHAVQIAVTTPSTANTVEATPVPAASLDGTYRCAVGVDIHAARGIQVTATPTLGATQWGVQRWEMRAVQSRAGPEEA